MKAAVLHGVNDLRIEDVPRPTLERNQVLIRIEVCGVCGTDVHMWAGTNVEGEFPFIPGHEWVGAVEELGPEANTLEKGDRVTGECFLACRTCRVCKDGGIAAFCTNHTYYGFQPTAGGGMAEYQVSTEETLHKVPKEVSSEEAALVEPVSVAYHAIWSRGGGVAPHDRVGIIGAGPIGLFAMQIAAASGAQVIVVEPTEYRQSMARDMGAKTIVDPSKEDVVQSMMKLTDGRGLTLTVECSGSEAGIANTVETAAIDGRIVLTGQSMGLKPPAALGKMIWKHAHMVGSCGSAGYFSKTLDYLSRKLAQPERIITHRFALDHAPEAFELGNAGTRSGKIMIYPDPAAMPEA